MPGHLTRNASQLTWFRSPAGSLGPDVLGLLHGWPNGSVLLQMDLPRAQGCCHSIQHARAEHLGLMEEPFRHPVRPM
jgi:hypothetical protein